MSSIDKRGHISPEKQQTSSGQEPISFADNFPSTVAQLPFPQITPLSPSTGETPVAIDPSSSPGTTRNLVMFTQPLQSAGNVTRQLTETLSGTFAPSTTVRQPVVIRATGKKSTGITRPPEGRRMVVHVAVTVLMLAILAITLLAVLPTANGEHGFTFFQPLTDMVKNKNTNTLLITQQAATATAVTRDGFEAGNGTTTYAGLPSAPVGYADGSDHFTYGQCTWWASYRYHYLTGLWVPWFGNAWQWTYGAENSPGWIVSSKPVLHAIMVMQPGVQGAGWYGHVNIVEQINADGSVVTSNYNWAGWWNHETFVTFHPGPGIAFVYHA